jgi:hypothetical protein
MTSKWPPITDAERARMTTDYSDAGVQRVAEQMRALDSQHELTAVERAKEYRAACRNDPKEVAYWSRIIVELLAPPRPTVDANASDMHEPPALAPEGTAAAPPPRARAYPVAGAPARKPREEDGQGSLF